METNLENNLTSMPRIGDKAPSFTAKTTQGEIRFPEDYAGKWSILFSHPADFTPVCTSEFMTFATMRTIKEKIEYKGMKDVEVTFPLIEDITMNVAKKYGMIQPNENSTQAVRAVFFVDPKGIIRTIIYYPLALGRNFDELKRILIGLQTADEFGVALPADWRPGDDVIVPTAGSCGVAKDRMASSADEMHCYDWFFCTKKLSKEAIDGALLKN